jgi:predicted DNA-binding protein
MRTTQIQLKVSLSEQLNDLLQSKAARLGVPVTQFVKHIIMKEVEDEEYPTFRMSEKTEKKIEQAMEDYSSGKAIKVENVSEFFKNL